MFFINFAGFPPQICPPGIDLETTLPAATIDFSPTITPFKIVDPPPMKACFLIIIA